MKDAILKTDSLTIRFDKMPVLWDLTFEIPSQALVAILGPNGAGKSTLLKAAMGIVKPFSGSIQFIKNPTIAYVPQRESVDWDFPITAYELVLMGRYGKMGLFRRPKKSDLEAVERALDILGMTPFKNRQINELSGGQKQRLFIARALVNDPEVLLMDEPFCGIDITTEKILMELFLKLRKEKKSIIIVHHDLTTVEKYYDWMVLLNTRLVVSGPVQDALNQENIRKTFGNHPSLLEEVQLLNQKMSTGLMH